MFWEFIILFVTCYILLVLKFNLEKKWKNLPPGPFQFPLTGNLIQYALRMDQRKKYTPFLAFAKMSKDYGPLMTIKLGMFSQVVIDDPDLIKEVLASEVWSDRYFDILYGVRSFDRPYGLLFSSGEEWKEMRRFSLRTLRDFGFGKHKDQETVFQEELEELMTRLDAKIDKSDKGQLIQPMEQYFTLSVLNILWSLVAGERFSHDDERLKGINDATSKLIRENPVGAKVWHAYPSRLTRFFVGHFLPSGRSTAKYMKEMQEFFRGMLEERRALGHYKEDQKDFIEVFLKEIENQKEGKSSNPNSKFYTVEQFIVVTLDLFHAGSETTSNTLEFSILYMILHPDVQKKVQAEIDAVVGQSRFPSYALDHAKMPYTEATIHEIQRMSSVVPLDNRNATQDTMLGGHFIPKGTPSIINIHSVHYSEKVWADPCVFRPERFLDAEQKNVINTNKIIPFGGGKRLCLGEAMARGTLFTYFTTFLQKYNFAQVPNKSPPPMEPAVGFTLCPQAYDVVISYR